ncbi:acetyltransferase [Photobacterium kishitanii]|uniref:N-acetyltransferase n=1 Tax=Photobacterium kishitanii TaxID=318456 RepID=A0AAX0YTY5_9GAMM|nr:N-acetyltransferase [Photobacterium kishitanii]KJG58512.1 acetyltransferase [Photobacterium kishitanii]KJG61799.1 acetyltransferase [Photobacterium kishitanii]KJG66449.1 acetyltransferase [Photobacterium kishitanii]KJG70062.1 acetyltransferase [Photobacterium kishitanii]OBU25322.1 acetyltransferase [Photobacterium kishitanii]
MLIRSEAPADILLIDALLKSVFETDAEANLVMRLRENGCRTLSLVACTDDGEVIGHAFFSPVTVAGQETNWQGLAPLAVREDHRHQGVGLALLAEAQATLADFDYPTVVVLGDPNYYQQAGYQPALKHGLTCSWPDTEEAFMVLEVVPGSVKQYQGLVEYCEEFNALA